MQKKLEELQNEFVSDLNNGLTEEQVAINRETHGVNKLEEKEKTPWIIKFLLQFKDPLIIILIVAAVVPGLHLESPPPSGGVPSAQGENIPIPHPAFEAAASAKVGCATDGL